MNNPCRVIVDTNIYEEAQEELNAKHQISIDELMDLVRVELAESALHGEPAERCRELEETLCEELSDELYLEGRLFGILRLLIVEPNEASDRFRKMRNEILEREVKKNEAYWRGAFNV